MASLMQDSLMDRTIAVFGGYGHSGQFVVSGLRRRGWTPILCERDPEQTAGQLFDAGDFLASLRPEDIVIEFD